MPATCDGYVRMFLPTPALSGSHGMLVMLEVPDLTKVACHNREGCYARNIWSQGDGGLGSGLCPSLMRAALQG